MPRDLGRCLEIMTDASISWQRLLDLGRQLLGLKLLQLGDLGGGFTSKASSSPVFPDFVSALVEVRLDGLDEFVEGAAVVRVDGCESETCASFPSGDAAQPGFVLDDAVRNSHLAAKGRKEQNELNGIDIVGDHDKLSLLLFHEPGYIVDTLANHGSALGRGILLSSGPSLGTCNQPLLLSLASLRPVLVHELEELGGSLPVQSLVELVDWRWDLQSGLEDSLLALQPNVLGPFDESGKIPLRLDGLSDSEVSGSFLKKRIDNPLYLGLLDGQGSGGHLLSLLLGFLLNHFGQLLHLL